MDYKNHVLYRSQLVEGLIDKDVAMKIVDSLATAHFYTLRYNIDKEDYEELIDTFSLVRYHIFVCHTKTMIIDII